jgi:hypothetical protein
MQVFARKKFTKIYLKKFIMGYKTDFQVFVEANDLKKKDLASFLGVSATFISQLCNGQSKLPEDKLKQIKAVKEWDSSMFLPKSTPTTIVRTGDINGDGNNIAGGNINLPAHCDDAEEVEAIEIPIVPTAVVRQPDIKLSKWVDKFAGDAERLRFGEILANATLAREVKEPDMCPALKIGQYICLELLPKSTPIKNGKIYFIDHSQLGGFFRKLYDRGDNILCKAYNPTYEDICIDKAHIYDLYRIVGVFSTDVIEDVRDEQIDHFMEQTNHLIHQHDAHNANTEKLIANITQLVEQQGVLIEMVKEK